MVFLFLFIYTGVMKKQLLFLAVLCLCTPLLKAEDFSYQKKIFSSQTPLSAMASICQAVYVAPNWLLTAAHCITPVVSAREYDLTLNTQKGCSVRIVLAQEDDTTISAVIPCANVRFPQEVVNQKGEKVLPFDLALLYYKDGSVPYEYYDPAEGKHAFAQDADELASLLEGDESLRKKWENRIPARFPALRTVSATEVYPRPLRLLLANVDEETSYAVFPAAPVFVGNTMEDPSAAKATWRVPDFGVTHGDSGGGLMVRSRNGILELLGIVSAENRLSPEDNPEEGEDYLFFTAFDENVSLPFIKSFIGNIYPQPLLPPKPQNNPTVL